MDEYEGLGTSTASNAATMSSPSQSSSDEYEGLGNSSNSASLSSASSPSEPPSDYKGLSPVVNSGATAAPAPVDAYEGLVTNQSDWSGSAGEAPKSKMDLGSAAHWLASKAIQYGPGWVANQVQDIENGIGDVSNHIGKAYDWLAGPIQGGVGGEVKQMPKTALEKGAQVEQMAETGLKKAALGYESLYKPALENIQRIKAQGGVPTWTDVFYNIPGAEKLPIDIRYQLAKSLGIIGEPVLDPMLYLSPFGKTTVGEQAEKAGMLHPNIGEAGKLGHKSLLTAGGDTWIKGQPVLDAVGAGQEYLRKFLPGFHTMTDNPEFNQMAERTLKSPEGHANWVADEVYGKGSDFQKTIQENAEKMGIAPEELQRRIVDYIEPPGSMNPNRNIMEVNTEGYKPPTVKTGKMDVSLGKQGEGGVMLGVPSSVKDRIDAKFYRALNPTSQDQELLRGIQENRIGKTPGGIETGFPYTSFNRGTSPIDAFKQLDATGQYLSSSAYRQRLGDILPPDVKNLADNIIKSNSGMAASEGLNPTESYLHHSGTPEWGKYLRDTFNDVSKGIGGNSPKSDAVAAHVERTFANHTINEINDAALRGKLGDLFDESNYKDYFNGPNGYKGKVFSDDLAHIQAKRFLQNAKVSRVSDFMDQASKFYGISDEAHGAGMASGDIKPKDYSWVSSDQLPGGGKWFPKQMADFMNGMQNPKIDEMVQGWGKQFLQKASTAVKGLNFIYKFGSAPFNYFSNLKLSYLSHSLNPVNVGKALGIVARMGKRELTDRVVLHSPEYGDITEKELIEKARQNRAIGMGLYRSAVADSGLPDWMRNNPLSNFFGGMHNFAEDASRLPVFMTNLEKGATWEGAAKMTRGTEYDYSDLGKTDKQIAQFTPFYRFARQNMPAMMGKAITDPGRTFAVEKMREAWNKQNDAEEDQESLPDFQREMEPWFAGRNDSGEPVWIPGGRYNPEQDINHIMGASDEFGEYHPLKSSLKYALSMINPALKTPFEEAANTNLATGTSISKDEHAHGGLGEMVNLAPGIDMPSKIAYAFNQLSPFSQSRQLTDTTVPLKYRLMGYFSGIKPFAQDVQTDQMYSDFAKKKAIDELKNNYKLFQRRQASDEANGKIHQAKLDEVNAENAYEELLKLSQQVLR